MAAGGGEAQTACAEVGGEPASHPDLLAQRGEALLADPRDLAELLDRPEAAVLLAVLEDRGGHARADAVELVELLRARGVEVERLALGRRRGRPPAAALALAPRSGTSTWRPSSSLAARFSADRSARRRAPPARRTASNTRDPAASRYTPGRRTAPATCTMSRALPPPSASATWMGAAAGGGCRDGGSARPAAPPPAGRAPRGTARGGGCRAHPATLGGAGRRISAECDESAQASGSAPSGASARRSSRACPARR